VLEIRTIRSIGRPLNKTNDFRARRSFEPGFPHQDAARLLYNPFSRLPLRGLNMSTWAASTLPGAGAMLALLWCEATLAHHSASVFDPGTLIELRGEIVSFKLRSPHASFVIDAQEFIDDRPVGEVERWDIESESVPVLRSLGIDADTFEAGDAVTMIVARHRDHDFKFAHSHAIFDDFGEYVIGNSDRLYSPSLRVAAEIEENEIPDARLPATGSGLAGRWQQPLTLFDGAGPGLPLNDDGMAAWRSYDPKRSPANVCEPINIPDIFFSAFFLFEIRIDDNRAVLHNEYYDVVRTVPLDGSWAVADAREFGTVKGRIDGKTLIVDSRDFPASKWGLGIEEAHRADIPSSTMKTVTERFSVTPDGGTLIYEYTLADPAYLTRSHSGRVELTRAPDDEPFHAFDCDLESASMWSRVRGDPPLSAE
jgi:uncharacterized protein DUF6152